MNCPNCNVTLLLTEIHGVTVDYCPQCRGIWLEKGKLEKITEKNGSSSYSDRGYISDSHHSDRNENHYQDGHRRKKGLFDFFD